MFTMSILCFYCYSQHGFKYQLLLNPLATFFTSTLDDGKTVLSKDRNGGWKSYYGEHLQLAIPGIDISKQLNGTAEKYFTMLFQKRKLSKKLWFIGQLSQNFVSFKNTSVSDCLYYEKKVIKGIKRKSATSLIFDYSEIMFTLNEPPA